MSDGVSPSPKEGGAVSAPSKFVCADIFAERRGLLWQLIGLAAVGLNTLFVNEPTTQYNSATKQIHKKTVS